METLEIKNVLKADLLLVEVPDVYEIIHHDNGVIAVLDSVVQWEIKGSYTLLGKPDEISEEDAANLIPIKTNDGFFPDYSKHHEGGCYLMRFKTATESLMSAIETQVYWENPIPTPEIQGGYDEFGNFQGGWDDNWISEFEKAESRTFDRNRTLIFKKN